MSRYGRRLAAGCDCLADWLMAEVSLAACQLVGPVGGLRPALLCAISRCRRGGRPPIVSVEARSGPPPSPHGAPSRCRASLPSDLRCRTCMGRIGTREPGHREPPRESSETCRSGAEARQPGSLAVDQSRPRSISRSEFTTEGPLS